MSHSIGRSRFVGNGALIAVAMLAALGCYTISLKVSSERATVDRMRAQLVADAKDIRMLQSELRTRARLPELQRWNDSVLALSPPSAQQFVRDEVQLASYAPGATAPATAAPRPVTPAIAAPATAVPLLPVAPRPTNQLAPGMKTINYAVPAVSRTRLAALPVAAATPTAPPKAVTSAASSAGLDSTLLETVADAAAAAPSTDATTDPAGRRAPMQ